MTVTVNTICAEGFRHTVQIDDHELFADAPLAAGGKVLPLSHTITSMPHWVHARP